MNPIPTLDFETDAIASRPDYPPKPAGLAVRRPDGSKEYIAWGHPTGNTHTREDGQRELARWWDGPMLFQNGAFDIAVACKEFGLPWPKDPLLIHDTMFQIYLYDPHARTLSLKPSAHRILGIAPDEADTLERWIREHVPGISKENPWGAHISKAPASIVAPYAIGDVDRTWLLHEFLMPIVEKDGMLAAYQREQKLMPILEAASTLGIRVNVELLDNDLNKVYEPALVRVEKWLRERLKSPGCDFTPESLADALEHGGVVQPHEWIRTPKSGKRSVAQDNVIAVIKDKEVLKYVLYRNALAQCLSTFMRKWHRLAKRGGRIHPSWNSVRGDRSGGKQYGTKTGRLSSNDPNFQNISNEYEQEVPEGFPPLPLMRRYLLPEEGHEWMKRDFSSQEMRVTAHFEDGQLLQAYRDNPKLDPHAWAQDLIRLKTGMVLTRKATKTIGFALLYGAGATHIGESLGVEYHIAASLKNAYLDALPDVRELINSVKNRGRSGKPVRTWGGRLIYAEKGDRDLSYKLINHLVQGSSADITKESIIVYNDLKKVAKFLMTVHDENCATAPKECAVEEMKYLKEAMDTLPLDAPLASDGFLGENYADLREIKE